MADAWPITLCGILMDGTPDSNGIKWSASAMPEGWDSPPVRVDDDNLTGRHGGWGASRLYGPRLLTVTGIAHCSDMAMAFLARDLLHTLPGPSGSGELIVHETTPKSLTVRMGGSPRATDPIDIPNPYVKWQIPLVAHDPFKRSTTGTTTTVAAGATVTPASSGTAAADLVATTTSSGTVVLTAGGVTLTTTSVPSGTVIDTAARTVTGPSGEDLYSAVAPGSQWPALPPGGSLANAGTAGLSVTTYDTYA